MDEQREQEREEVRKHELDEEELAQASGGLIIVVCQRKLAQTGEGQILGNLLY